MRNGITTGKYHAPGLPEIFGEIYSGTIFDVHSGALRPSHSDEFGQNIGGISGNDGFTFYASLSNSIYGTTDTVMPASADVSMMLYLGRLA